MGNVGKRFLICFFSFTLCIIIFINYLGWSGAFVDILGWTNDTSSAWDGKYFGFTSFWSMISLANTSINSVDFFSYRSFIIHINSFTNSVLLGLPHMFNSLSNASEGLDILTLIEFLVILFFQPIIVVAHLLILIGHILWYAWCLLDTLFKAFGGWFNKPMDSMPNPNDYRYIGSVMLIS